MWLEHICVISVIIEYWTVNHHLYWTYSNHNNQYLPPQNTFSPNHFRMTQWKVEHVCQWSLWITSCLLSPVPNRKKRTVRNICFRCASCLLSPREKRRQGEKYVSHMPPAPCPLQEKENSEKNMFPICLLPPVPNRKKRTGRKNNVSHVPSASCPQEKKRETHLFFSDIFGDSYYQGGRRDFVTVIMKEWPT